MTKLCLWLFWSVFLSFSTMRMHAKACICWSKYTTNRHLEGERGESKLSFRNGMLPLWAKSILNFFCLTSGEHCCLWRAEIFFCLTKPSQSSKGKTTFRKWSHNRKSQYRSSRLAQSIAKVTVETGTNSNNPQTAFVYCKVLFISVF